MKTEYNPEQALQSWIVGATRTVRPLPCLPKEWQIDKLIRGNKSHSNQSGSERLAVTRKVNLQQLCSTCVRMARFLVFSTSSVPWLNIFINWSCNETGAIRYPSHSPYSILMSVVKSQTLLKPHDLQSLHRLDHMSMMTWSHQLNKNDHDIPNRVSTPTQRLLKEGLGYPVSTTFKPIKTSRNHLQTSTQIHRP